MDGEIDPKSITVVDEYVKNVLKLNFNKFESILKKVEENKDKSELKIDQMDQKMVWINQIAQKLHTLRKENGVSHNLLENRLGENSDSDDQDSVASLSV
jgi:mevalonate kinase